MKNCTQLKLLNTFSVQAQANYIVTAYNEFSLLKLWNRYNDSEGSVLILGEGSNILFLGNYEGTVLLNRIKGIFVTENKTEWKLHVGAGEKWNELVMYTINRNMPGLENLACIPGSVGAAPIQNLGAYGVELSQVCEYVDVLDLDQGNKVRLLCCDCNFQYRDSIFKNNLYKYAIIFVGLKLKKIWRPVLHHSALMNLNAYHLTPRQILNMIILIRNKKLPNPSINGNAGSFFKNPIVDIEFAYTLLKQYSNMPHYFLENGKIKLLAGWLIEQCKLKGYILGEASVYCKQALILINTRQRATGIEIAKLACYIRNVVANKFNIYLQPEVRFIGKNGEVNPNQFFNCFI